MQLPTLKGSRITIRRLKRSDCESIYVHIKDPRVLRYLPAVPNPYNRDDARTWIALTHRKARRDTAYHFGIEHNQEREIIGGMSFNEVNHHDLDGELGYWLAHRHWRKGYVSEALRLMLDFAFKELKLRRVYAFVAVSNRPSQALLEKHGFRREGTLRQSCRMKNRWHDEYLYALLRGEYQAPA